MNIFRLIAWLIEAYIWLIMFPYAILSWFRIQPGTTLARVQYFLFQATEPVLRPVRNLMPGGGMGMDFSPMIVSFILILILNVIDRSGG